MPLPLHLLRRHPFAVEAFFDWSLALVWSWPEEALVPLCDPGLELDTYAGQGFVAIALVKTRDLRPQGWPRWMGSDFVLVGYRLFTRYRTREGRRLRGLKVLGGGADSRRMVAMGTIFTQYRYRHLRVHLEEGPDRLAVAAEGGHEFQVIAETGGERPLAPPPGSIFPDLRTARRFAGPMPYTFDHEPETNAMVRVEGVRTQWQPVPVRVEIPRNSFLEQGIFAEIGPGCLANAFLVRKVAYSWKRGVVEALGDD